VCTSIYVCVCVCVYVPYDPSGEQQSDGVGWVVVGAAERVIDLIQRDIVSILATKPDIQTRHRARCA
jgi:hypothetical protein